MRICRKEERKGGEEERKIGRKEGRKEEKRKKGREGRMKWYVGYEANECKTCVKKIYI